MNFERFEIRHLEIPLKEPFETGFGEIKNRNVVILAGFDEEGRRFYGEASSQFAPLYNHEHKASVMEFLEKFVVPSLKDAEGVDEYNKLISCYRGNLMAKSAGEMLLHHRKLVEEGRTLSKLFEGAKDKVGCGVSIGIQDSPEELVEEVRKYKDRGYLRAKLKIKPGSDLEYLEAVRDEFPEYDLMVDANSSYSLSYLDRLKKLDSFDLEMLEQPLGHRDIVNHSMLAQELKTPICLDESVRSVEDVYRAAKLDACQVINLKPQRVGGINESKKINSACEEHEIDMWIGGLVESGIGAMYQLAAASMSQVNRPSDISPQSRYFSEEIVDKPEMKNGYIKIPSALDFGSRINHQKLEKLTKQKIEI